MTPFASLLALALATPFVQETPSASPTLGERFGAVSGEFDKARADFDEKYNAAKTDEERSAAIQIYPNAEKYAPRLLEIAKDAGGDPIGLKSCIWVLERVQAFRMREDAYELLLAHHLASPKLGDAIKSVGRYQTTVGAERFARAAMEKSPHHEVKGLATYALANVLIGLAKLHETLSGPDAKPEFRAMNADYYGAETLDEIGARDPQEMRDEADDLLEDVVADYPNVKGMRAPLGAVAENDLFELRNLQIGMTAPDIVGADVDGVAFKLSDYRGKVVVLDFWGFW